MNLKSEIEDCCIYLKSNKVTDRRKYCEKFCNLLERKDVVSVLNKGTLVSWKQVLFCVQECLKLVSN